MKATDAPTIQSPSWNKFRYQVIAAITDVEAIMQQLGKGLDTEGMTYEIAPRLGLKISTPADFEALSTLVRAVRHVGREAIRTTCEDQGGQFSLLLL